MERIYKPLQVFSDDKIEQLLLTDSIEELISLQLSVGQNHSDWKFAQDLCIKLPDYPEARVRANAILGLAYIARTKGKLEKHLVKPILMRALREESNYNWRIIDAVKDINLFMGWNLGKKLLNKI